jgi:methylmalonyl-CoA/ethylmalonyl-CoA epimerase
MTPNAGGGARVMTPVQAVNHVGIAVRSIEAQRGFYEGVLGAEFEGVETVTDQMTRVGFFRIGAVRIELLEPTDPSSPVARFLEKRGEGLHHVAFSVANLEERLAELRAEGLRLVDESPRAGARGMRIAFLHPRSTFGVLTELCEPPEGAHG